MAGVSELYAIYAVLLLVGGVIGFVRAGSAPSLVAGVVAAGLMFVAFGLLGHGNTRGGLILGAVVGAVMDAFFVMRYVKTRKMSPAIPLAVVSVGVLAFSIIKLAGG